MPEPRIVTTAVIISLIAGIVIILGSFYAPIWEIGMILGLVSGIVVFLAAIMLKVRPGEGTRGLRTCCLLWGGMILIFSIIGLIAGVVDGYNIFMLIGAILGIIGAALAMTVKV